MRTYPDPFWRRWSRRAITYTAVFLGLILMTALAPVWIAGALLVDLFRRVKMSTIRATCFVYSYIAFQAYGLICALGLWLADRILPRRTPQRLVDWMFWLEFDWAVRQGRTGIKLFGMRVNVEEEYTFTGERPVILLVRHASITDTFVPILYCCAPYNLNYRYVMKRELEWDPCLDIAVNRMPHLFVRRGSEDSRLEIEAIGSLIKDAGPGEGVIIFPEGTRYTPAKRERILKKLRASGQHDILQWAEQYRYCLPPRLGGPIALIENAPPDTDVVICADRTRKILAHRGYLQRRTRRQRGTRQVLGHPRQRDPRRRRRPKTVAAPGVEKSRRIYCGRPRIRRKRPARRRHPGRYRRLGVTPACESPTRTITWSNARRTHPEAPTREFRPRRAPPSDRPR